MTDKKIWWFGVLILASVLMMSTGVTLIAFTATQKDRFVKKATEEMDYFYDQTAQRGVNLYEDEKILEVAKSYFDDAIGYGASEDDPLYAEILYKIHLYQDQIKEQEKLAQEKTPAKRYDKFWLQFDTGIDKFRSFGNKNLNTNQHSSTKH